MIYQKSTVCPYCGTKYRKGMTSIDHIIPKQIGGADKFRVVSCSGCNSKISKIEQQALRTITMNYLITEVDEDGFKIGKRRKRNRIPLQKGFGLAFKAPVKMYYDTDEKRRILQIFSRPDSPYDENFFKRESFHMIVPELALEEDEKEIISMTSLTNKIMLGTCAWLWGDEFSRSNHADYMRHKMWNVKMDEILKMGSSDKHLELPNQPDKDAMDNRPHHSILISHIENTVVGLLNLFGSYESMMVIGKLDATFEKWLNGTGMVVISKTTNNDVLKMTWEDYEKYKSAGDLSVSNKKSLLDV